MPSYGRGQREVEVEPMVRNWALEQPAIEAPADQLADRTDHAVLAGETVAILARQAGVTAISIENIAEATPAGAARTYDGRSFADDLLGGSELLIRRSDRFVATYIKSGHGEECGADDGRP